MTRQHKPVEQHVRVPAVAFRHTRIKAFHKTRTQPRSSMSNKTIDDRINKSLWMSMLARIMFIPTSSTLPEIFVVAETQSTSIVLNVQGKIVAGQPFLFSLLGTHGVCLT